MNRGCCSHGGALITTVLLIEDDELVATLVERILARANYEVARAGAGRAGLRLAHELCPDLVILDVGLPDLDGWEVLDRLRDISEVPVLMLSARSEHADRVRGLRSGADDYLTKPFDHDELQARVEALLRRAGRTPAPVAEDLVIDGRLTIDLANRSVSMDQHDVPVTPIEFRLLHALFRNRGRVLSPEQLLEIAWGDASGISPERVKFSIHRLRRKLGWAAEDCPIQAVRGFGYRYRRRADV